MKKIICEKCKNEMELEKALECGNDDYAMFFTCKCGEEKVFMNYEIGVSNIKTVYFE